jgi:hypothetical protein
VSLLLFWPALLLLPVVYLGSRALAVSTGDRVCDKCGMCITNKVCARAPRVLSLGFDDAFIAAAAAALAPLFGADAWGVHCCRHARARLRALRAPPCAACAHTHACVFLVDSLFFVCALRRFPPSRAPCCATRSSCPP